MSTAPQAARKISVVVPVYNERSTVESIVSKIKQSLSALQLEGEIIVVNDGSTDGSAEILRSIPDIVCVNLDQNQGKGAAVRAGFKIASGEITLVQDADLEYDPKDYGELLAPILDGRADVVYGSRFLGGPHRVLLYWHYIGNLIFTTITNILYNVNLTDMGTCYKVFKTGVLKRFEIKSNRFGFEPEITAKICKAHLRIYETPISYSGRTYAEGKKITWKDGLVYLWCLLKYRFVD